MCCVLLQKKCFLISKSTVLIVVVSIIVFDYLNFDLKLEQY